MLAIGFGRIPGWAVRSGPVRGRKKEGTPVAGGKGSTVDENGPEQENLDGLAASGTERARE